MTREQAREYERQHPKMAALIRKVIRQNRVALEKLARYDRTSEGEK